MKKATRGSNQGEAADIVKIILEHHKDLKKLIKTLKKESDYMEKESAFEEFAPLLLAHAKPEAETLYKAMKEDDDLRLEGFEGETEHDIAERLVDEIQQTKDDDAWAARVKVLAELVEHHIMEEEKNLLPHYRKASDEGERAELGRQYSFLREEMINKKGSSRSWRSAPSSETQAKQY